MKPKKEKSLFVSIAITLVAGLISIIGWWLTIDYDTKPDTHHDQKAGLKIGFWNVANYSENNDPSKQHEIEIRAKVLADIITYQNIDLLVVVEPEYQDTLGFTRLLKQLNDLNHKKHYQGLVSLPTVSDKKILKRTSLSERYGFIYNDHKLQPKKSPEQASFPTIDDFSDNTPSTFDVTPTDLANQYGDRNVLFYKEKVGETNFYTRKPGAIAWTDLTTKTEFVTVAAHFSSPGANSKQGETLVTCKKSFPQFNCDQYVTKLVSKDTKRTSPPPLGSGEAYDAIKIPNVINQFKTRFGIENIFFLADTNVAWHNRFVFKPALDAGLKTLWSVAAKTGFQPHDSFDLYHGPLLERTTLSTVLNKFANSYDRIFYQTRDWSVTNPYAFNLWSMYFDVAVQGNDRVKQTIPALSFPNQNHYTKQFLDDLWYQQLKKGKITAKTPLSRDSLINLASDHTMVTFNLHLSVIT